MSKSCVFLVLKENEIYKIKLLRQQSAMELMEAK